MARNSYTCSLAVNTATIKVMHPLNMYILTLAAFEYTIVSLKQESRRAVPVFVSEILVQLDYLA